MSYEVRIIPSAEKEMNRLPAAVHARLSKRINTLADNPRPRGVRKLSGRDEYRMRVGDYRVLYILDDKNRVLVVLAVGHRRGIYD